MSLVSLIGKMQREQGEEPPDICNAIPKRPGKEGSMDRPSEYLVGVFRLFLALVSIPCVQVLVCTIYNTLGGSFQSWLIDVLA